MMLAYYWLVVEWNDAVDSSPLFIVHITIFIRKMMSFSMAKISIMTSFHPRPHYDIIAHQ